MQPRELPCGRVLLAAAALLSVAAPTARAQVREGVPTSITMALAGGLATLNAVAHPPMSYAGRDAEGVPHSLGTPERSCDWPHVELADAPLGFRSVEALLEAARR